MHRPDFTVLGGFSSPLCIYLKVLSDKVNQRIFGWMHIHIAATIPKVSDAQLRLIKK